MNLKEVLVNELLSFQNIMFRMVIVTIAKVWIKSSKQSVAKATWQLVEVIS
jgi:hypothetical protein